jgi:hypothetical protein
MDNEDAAQPEPAADGVRLEPLPHPIDTLIDRWFDDHMRGSIVASQTAIWNHCHGAAQDLKRRLKESM